MKKIILFTIVIFTQLVQLSGQDQIVNPIILKELTTQPGVDLRILPQESNVLIKFYNDKDELIMSQKATPNSEFAKRFNMKSLEDGDFSMEITCDEWKFEQSFSKSKNQILLSDQNESFVLYPEWAVMTNKIIIPAQTEEHILPTGLTLYDEAGREVYDYKMTKNSHLMGIKFDLSKLPVGDYAALLHTSEKNLTRNFTKD